MQAGSPAAGELDRRHPIRAKTANTVTADSVPRIELEDGRQGGSRREQEQGHGLLPLSNQRLAPRVFGRPANEANLRYRGRAPIDAMSSIYIIRDLTSERTWYEASFSLLEEIQALASNESVSFFVDYEFEPDESAPGHVVPAHQVAPQLQRLLAAIEERRRSRGQTASHGSRSWLEELFTDMLTECLEHPDHRWTSCVFH